MQNRESVPFSPENLLCLKKNVFPDQTKQSCFKHYTFKEIQLLLIVFNTTTDRTVCCHLKEEVLYDNGKSRVSVLELLDGKIRQQLGEGNNVPSHWALISQDNIDDIGVQANHSILLSVSNYAVTLINDSNYPTRQIVYRVAQCGVRCNYSRESRQLTLSIRYYTAVESYDITFIVDLLTAEEIIRKLQSLPNHVSHAYSIQGSPLITNRGNIARYQTNLTADPAQRSTSISVGNPSPSLPIQRHRTEIQMLLNGKEAGKLTCNSTGTLSANRSNLGDCPKPCARSATNVSEIRATGDHDSTFVKQSSLSATPRNRKKRETLTVPTMGPNLYNSHIMSCSHQCQDSNQCNTSSKQYNAASSRTSPITSTNTTHQGSYFSGRSYGDFQTARKYRTFYLTLLSDGSASSPKMCDQWMYNSRNPCEHEDLSSKPPPAPHSIRLMSSHSEDEELPTPPPCKPVPSSMYLTPVLTRCSSIDIFDTLYPPYVNISTRNRHGSVYLEDADDLYANYVRVQSALQVKNKKLVILESVDVYDMYPTQEELNEQLRADYKNDLSRINRMCYNPAGRPLQANVAIKKCIPDLSNDISITLDSLKRHSTPKIEAIFKLRWKAAKDLIVHLSFDRKPPAWHELAYKLNILSKYSDITLIDDACRIMKELPAELVLVHWEFLHGRHRSHRPCNRDELIKVMKEMKREDLVSLVS